MVTSSSPDAPINWQYAFRAPATSDARSLEGRVAQVAIAGSGDVDVNVSESLDVTIAGSGDVSYLGSPRVSQRIRGSGRVHKAK